MQPEKSNCCLPFTLFSGLSIVISVQIVGFVKIFAGLCKLVPKDKEYCIEKHEGNQTNQTTLSKEQVIFGVYEYLIVLSAFIELCAFWALCSHIFTCVKYCCVPVCYSIWKCCFGCGNCWYPTLIIGVVLNLGGHLAIGFVFDPEDLFTYIEGIVFTLASLLTGMFMVIIWAIYLCRNGWPPAGYFLGSNKKVSDYNIETNTERGRIETRHPGGYTTSQKYKLKHHRLVRKAGSSSNFQDNTGYI